VPLCLEHRKWLNVEWNFPVPKIPIMFWNVNGKEEQYPGGTSYFNRVEAENIARLVKILLDAGVSPGQLGIITPYEAQRANIVHLLMQRGIFNRIDEESNLFDNNERIEIANVDSFQVC
jgi:regulator of nonsense transcripts 1